MTRFCSAGRLLFISFFLLVALAPAGAQIQTPSEAAPATTTTLTTPPQAAPPAKGLTVDEFIKLSQAGL
jgi:hypothetical protein